MFLCHLYVVFLFEKLDPIHGLIQFLSFQIIVIENY